MAWKIWKGDKERYDEEFKKGINERNKRNYDGAIEHFQKAAEIGIKSKEPELRAKGVLAAVMAAFYQMMKQTTASSFENLKSSLLELVKLNPDTELDLALPYEIKVSELLQEIDLLKDWYSLPQFTLELDKYEDLNTIANKYETVAQKLISYGRETFLIQDLLKLEKPFRIAFRLLAYSRILKAYMIVNEEPSKALELYSEAMGYLEQVQDQTIMNFAKTQHEKISIATKCWACHRNIQGEDVHFVYLQTEMTPFIKKNYGNDVPNLLVEREAGTYVAVCKTCYGAIYYLSDKISRYYYKLAMEALKEVEIRLTQRIEELSRIVSELMHRYEELMHRYEELIKKY
jgi:tetratricopeptide (TPR) repeat protein